MLRMEYRWLSAYEPQVPATLQASDACVTDWLREAADRFPERPAVSFMGKTLSFRQLLAYASRFAGALRQLGIREGDRVALMLPNVPQYVIGYYGTLLLGGVVVQTNPLYTERELTHHLRDADVSAIVCLDLVFGKLQRVREHVELPQVIVTSVKDFLPTIKKWLYPLAQKRKRSPVPVKPKPGEAHSFMELLSASELFTGKPVAGGPDETAVLQYTGGTTGTAKGVMLTHRNLTANVRQCQAWMYRNEEANEAVLAAVPLFHVYGMTVCMNYAVRMAARLVLVPRFEPEVLLKTIDRERPTIFPGAPTMYIALLHHPMLPRYELSSITCCISGSAALPLHVKQRFEKVTGGKLVEGYGLSEASPVTHVNPIWGRNVPGSIGLPLPDTVARIVDPSGLEDRELHEIGELVIKGPQVMKGYWRQPEETNAVLEDGWLRTGDMAYQDEQGYFYIVDRKKEMINAGGLKVYPREVEEVLYSHPAVQEAAVIGVPDEYRGETVKAFIVCKADARPEEAELSRFCRERLAPYKVPRSFEFRAALPKTMIGKVLRRALMEEERAIRTAGGTDRSGEGTGAGETATEQTGEEKEES